jgi:hypothetical protein
VWAEADQPIFDRRFDCAKLRVQAGITVSRPWPFETTVILKGETARKRLGVAACTI